jgi:hypothetical protein
MGQPTSGTVYASFIGAAHDPGISGASSPVSVQISDFGQVEMGTLLGGHLIFKKTQEISVFSVVT